MKDLLQLLAAAMLISGGTLEFYKHDALFKTNPHAACGWWGYKNTTAGDAKTSFGQDWWGKEIPYVPAK